MNQNNRPVRFSLSLHCAYPREWTEIFCNFTPFMIQRLITFVCLSLCLFNHGLPLAAQADLAETDHLHKEVFFGVDGNALAYSGDVGKSNLNTGNFSFGLHAGIQLNRFAVYIKAQQGRLQWNGVLPNSTINFKTTFSSYSLEPEWRLFRSGISPFIRIGLGSMTFSTSTDLVNSSGLTYFYWDDGSIRDQVQSAENLATSTLLKRDYSYETPVAQNQRLSYFPVTIGLSGPLSSQLNLHVAYKNMLLQGDMFDGVIQSGGWDRLASVEVGLSYTFSFAKKKAISNPTAIVDFSQVDFESIFHSDEDGDGIDDLKDLCYGTPVGAPVDEFGCSPDADGDGIIDFLDKEPNSPENSRVDQLGVSWSDEAYIEYMNDSLAYFTSTLRRVNRNSRPYPVKKFIPTSRLIAWNAMLSQHPEWISQTRNRSDLLPVEFKQIDENGDQFLSIDELEKAINKVFDSENTMLNEELIRKAIEYAFRQ